MASKTVLLYKCDALRDLVAFVQFKKRQKHPCLQLKACNFTKITTPPWVFFMFFKLYKWYQISQRTTFELFLIKESD